MEFIRIILRAIVDCLLVTYGVKMRICIGVPVESVSLRKRRSLSSGIAQL